MGEPPSSFSPPPFLFLKMGEVPKAEGVERQISDALHNDQPGFVKSNPPSGIRLLVARKNLHF
jgi:hypothetical protein